MLERRKISNIEATPKQVAVIRNGHTDAEFNELEERWINHPGPYRALADVVAIEKAKQVDETTDESQP